MLYIFYIPVLYRDRTGSLEQHVKFIDLDVAMSLDPLSSVPNPSKCFVYPGAALWKKQIQKIKSLFSFDSHQTSLRQRQFDNGLTYVILFVPTMSKYASVSTSVHASSLLTLLTFAFTDLHQDF